MSDSAVALVTNGTYGVGREVVRCLDGAGVRVAVGARPGELDNGDVKPPEEAASVHQVLHSFAGRLRPGREGGHRPARSARRARLHHAPAGLGLEVSLERPGLRRSRTGTWPATCRAPSTSSGPPSARC